ncbi:hypothetical protein BpHYR1_017495 [Brachionus plicatilis]|uniref:FLYWCH-type domain-containing protein n=1 Tax=Brachionus plicatilis TaxID=10195 RepID=A0A3M7QP74_BRAPC|nr:hypothetical protein BpHYR1_017495 [Brachionus plicatilis]
MEYCFTKKNYLVSFITSIFGTTEQKNAHPIAIYENYSYWWKRDNKKSTQFVCSHESCYASIHLKDDIVLKESGKHYHDK